MKVRYRLSNNTKRLWNELPERYQPVFGNESELPGNRETSDRFRLIADLVEELSSIKKRKLRILDIGSSQGYFTLGLASLGHQVVAIDQNELNVQFLESLINDFELKNRVEASCADATDFLQSNQAKFDLVLCFSVLHHIYFHRGRDVVSNLVNLIREHGDIALFELAIKEEGIYWSDSLPSHPLNELTVYNFVAELGLQNTHLGLVTRPIIFASDGYFYASSEKKVKTIDMYITPHPFGDENQKKRKAFVVAGNLIKLQIHNEESFSDTELSKEVSFLDSISEEVREALNLPKLIDFQEGKFVSVVTRDFIPGQRLDQVLNYTNRLHIWRAVMEHISNWAAFQLYPNDIRPWNFLLNPEGRVTYIDYGRSSNELKDASGLSLDFVMFRFFLYFFLDLESPTFGQKYDLDVYSNLRRATEFLRQEFGGFEWTPHHILGLAEPGRLNNESVYRLFFGCAEETVASLNTQIQELTGVLTQIQNSSQELTKASRQIEILVNEKLVLEEELFEIRNSRTWRSFSNYRKIKAFISRLTSKYTK